MKEKYRVQNGPAGTDTAAPATTPDAEFVRRIARLVTGFMSRTVTTFLLLAVIIQAAVWQHIVTPKNTLAVLAAASFGMIFPFVRGARKAFQEILRMGKEELASRRYANAVFALEYFHRLGQMSFDPTGEAHYYLVGALLGLRCTARARGVAEWMEKHRARHGWAAKAMNDVRTAECRHPVD